MAEKYAQMSSDLGNLVKSLSNSHLQEVGNIISTVRHCSILRLRLYVVVPELQNFVVCCNNLLFLEKSEIADGLQLLLASILPSFPNSPEMRTRVRMVMQELTKG
jgi:hypothetical protein